MSVPARLVLPLSIAWHLGHSYAGVILPSFNATDSPIDPKSYRSEPEASELCCLRRAIAAMLQGSTPPTHMVDSMDRSKLHGDNYLTDGPTASTKGPRRVGVWKMPRGIELVREKMCVRWGRVQVRSRMLSAGPTLEAHMHVSSNHDGVFVSSHQE